MILFKCKKSGFVTEVFAGLSMLLILGSAVAIPLQQEMSEDFSTDAETRDKDSLFIHSELNRVDGDIELQPEHESIFSDIMDAQSMDGELQNLKNSIYSQDIKKRDKQKFYSTQINKEPSSQTELILHEEKKKGLSSLLEPLDDDPQLKEKVKESLEAIKDVKQLLAVNSEVSFESSKQETDQLIKNNLYQQQQQRTLDEKGINNKVSKGKYDPSIFRDFFSRIWTFVLYAVLGIIFMKLVLKFISWQRKINQY